MGVARSSYYAAREATRDDTALVEAMVAICAEFEAYGWRRVQAALRLQGMVANHKKIKRLMREHDLQPRMRRRFARTTDSDHDQPIFPDRTKELIVDGPNQLWVADLTYVAIAAGFVYHGQTGSLTAVRPEGPTPIGGPDPTPIDRCHLQGGERLR
jgi:putative transposase